MVRIARIYVSSPFNDLEECCELARLQIRQMGHEDIFMDYVVDNQCPLDKCLNDVSSCNLHIGFFAGRYSYIPSGYEKSITELEYRKTFDTGKGQDVDKLAELWTDLSKERLLSFFKAPQEYKSFVATVHNWERNRIE